MAEKVTPIEVLPLTPVAGGLNKIQSPLEVEDSESTELLNWNPLGGILRPRAGSAQAFTLANSPAGFVNGIKYSPFHDATSFLCVHTKNSFQTFNGSSVVDRTPSAGNAFAGSNTDDDLWSSTTVLNYYFFTNNISELYYWDGAAATATKVINGPGPYAGPASLMARYVIGFAGRVFLGYCTETGVKTTRVRWCGDSTPFNWSSSSAGSADLEDTPGAITGFATLGDNLLVLKEDSIVFCRESGDPATPIIFPYYNAVGCIAGNSFQAITSTSGIFLGPDNFYLINGQDVRPIGDKVAPLLFDDRTVNEYGLTWSRTRYVVSWVEPENGTYVCVVPTGTDSYALTAYCYNFREDRWSLRTYPSHVYSAVGNVPISPSGSGASSTTWNSFSGRWIDSPATTTRWDDYGTTQLSKRRVYLGVYDATVNNRVFYTDSGLLTDGSNYTINRAVTTKKFRFNPSGSSTVTAVYVSYNLTGSSTNKLTLEVITEAGTQGLITKTYSKSDLTTGENITIKFDVRVTGELHSFRVTTLQDFSINHMAAAVKTRYDRSV